MPSGICGIIEKSILHFSENHSVLFLNVAQSVSLLLSADIGPTVI